MVISSNLLQCKMVCRIIMFSFHIISVVYRSVKLIITVLHIFIEYGNHDNVVSYHMLFNVHDTSCLLMKTIINWNFVFFDVDRYFSLNIKKLACSTFLLRLQMSMQRNMYGLQTCIIFLLYYCILSSNDLAYAKVFQSELYFITEDD